MAMQVSIPGFAVGQMMARRYNITNPAAVTQVSLLGAMFGSSPAGLALTSTLAQRQAPPPPPPPAKAPSGLRRSVGKVRMLKGRSVLASIVLGLIGVAVARLARDIRA